MDAYKTSLAEWKYPIWADDLESKLLIEQFGLKPELVIQMDSKKVRTFDFEANVIRDSLVIGMALSTDTDDDVHSWISVLTLPLESELGII